MAQSFWEQALTGSTVYYVEQHCQIKKSTFKNEAICSLLGATSSQFSEVWYKVAEERYRICLIQTNHETIKLKFSVYIAWISLSHFQKLLPGGQYLTPLFWPFFYEKMFFHSEIGPSDWLWSTSPTPDRAWIFSHAKVYFLKKKKCTKVTEKNAKKIEAENFGPVFWKFSSSSNTTFPRYVLVFITVVNSTKLVVEGKGCFRKTKPLKLTL